MPYLLAYFWSRDSMYDGSKFFWTKFLIFTQYSFVSLCWTSITGYTARSDAGDEA